MANHESLKTNIHVFNNIVIILQLAVTVTNKLYIWGASPQVLRLQAQAQKKARILQQQVALEKTTRDSEAIVDKYNENAPDNNSVKQSEQQNAQINDTEDTNHSTNNTAAQSKNSCNQKLPKSRSFRGINVGMVEESQTHLQPCLVDTSLVCGQIVQVGFMHQNSKQNHPKKK